MRINIPFARERPYRAGGKSSVGEFYITTNYASPGRPGTWYRLGSYEGKEPGYAVLRYGFACTTFRSIF